MRARDSVWPIVQYQPLLCFTIASVNLADFWSVATSDTAYAGDAAMRELSDVVAAPKRSDKAMARSYFSRIENALLESALRIPVANDTKPAWWPRRRLGRFGPSGRARGCVLEFATTTYMSSAGCVVAGWQAPSREASGVMAGLGRRLRTGIRKEKAGHGRSASLRADVPCGGRKVAVRRWHLATSNNPASVPAWLPMSA